MTAELTRDTLTETGVVLTTGTPEAGMAEQSHVEIADPGFLLHDYLRRMRSVLTALRSSAAADSRAAPGWPESVLHLGAGALTLPRWFQWWRPSVRQTVVDIEPELVEFVLEHLPMQPHPRNVVADAAEVLAPGGALSQERFDVVVVDLFNSSQAPASLTSREFFAHVLSAVSPEGVMMVNFGDDADMGFARGITRTMLAAAEEASARNSHAHHDGRPTTLVSAPGSVLAAREEGNLVFAFSRRGFTEQQLQMMWAAGPHPGEVLSGEELHAWAG